MNIIKKVFTQKIHVCHLSLLNTLRSFIINDKILHRSIHDYTIPNIFQMNTNNMYTGNLATNFSHMKGNTKVI